MKVQNTLNKPNSIIASPQKVTLEGPPSLSVIKPPFSEKKSYTPWEKEDVLSRKIANVEERTSYLNELSEKVKTLESKISEYNQKTQNLTSFSGIDKVLRNKYNREYDIENLIKEYQDVYKNYDRAYESYEKAFAQYEPLMEEYKSNLLSARSPAAINAQISSIKQRYEDDKKALDDSQEIQNLITLKEKYKDAEEKAQREFRPQDIFKYNQLQKEIDKQIESLYSPLKKKKDENLALLESELRAYYESLQYRDDFEENSKPNGYNALLYFNALTIINDGLYDAKKANSNGEMPAHIISVEEDKKRNTFLKHATKDEKKLAYYIANTMGGDAVSDYIAFNSDTMNRRKAGEMVKYNATLPPVIKQIHQGAITLGAGLDDFSQNMEGVGNAIKSTFTGKSYDTPSPTSSQYASGVFVENASGIGKVALAGVRSIGNMAVPIATTVLTGGAAGSVLFGVSAAGGGYNEKINAGWEHDEALAYGIISGISEVFLERMLGGITKLGGGKVLSSVDDWIKGIKSGVTRATLTMAKKGMSEFTEEGLQTFLEPIYSSIISGEEYTPAELEEIIFSGLVGMFTVGPLESYDFVKDASTLHSDTVNEIIARGEKAEAGTVERLVAEEIKSQMAQNPNYSLTSFEYARLQKYYKRNANTPSVLPSDKYQSNTTKNTPTESVEVEESKAKINYQNYTQNDFETNAKTLVSMTSVKDLTGNEFKKEGTITLREKVMAFFNKLGNKVYSERFGNVDLTLSSFRSEAAHGWTKGKIVSFEAIPEVIKNGVVIDSQRRGNGNYDRIVVAAPITIAGQEYYMGVMLQRDEKSQRLYLHDVITKEKASLSNSEHLSSNRVATESDSLFMTSILQKAVLVNSKNMQKKLDNSNRNYVRIEESPTDNAKSGVTDGVGKTNKAGITAMPEGLTESESSSIIKTEPISDSTHTVPQTSPEVKSEEVKMPTSPSTLLSDKYQSNTTKNTPTSVEAEKETIKNNSNQYSISVAYSNGDIETLSDARNLTDEQAIEYLNQAKSGKIKGQSYIPIRSDTPQVIIDTVAQIGESIGNHSLVMQVRKAQQAMSSENPGAKNKAYGSNVRKHSLTPEKIIDIVNNIDNTNLIVYQTNRQDKNGNALPNNVAVFVEYNNDGDEGVAVIEFDGLTSASEFVGSETGDTNYHTVVTVFEPDTARNGMPFDYAEEILSNPNNIELQIARRPNERSATREKHPNTSNELPSNNTIPQTSPEVKSKEVQMPTVSRDGIEIKNESDPEVQRKLAEAKDDLERTGILSGASEKTIALARRLEKALGVKIRFEVSPVGTQKNGRYNRIDDTIYVNMAENNHPVIQVIVHEFVHAIEKTRLHSMLRSFAQKEIDRSFGKGAFNNNAHEQMKIYEEKGKKLTLYQAENEVVCNFISEKLLKSEETITRFVNEHKEPAQKLKNIIDGVLSVFGKGDTKDDARTRLALQKASKLYRDAMNTRKTGVDLKGRIDDLRQKARDGEISDAEYETALERLAAEADALDLNVEDFFKGGGDSYSISPNLDSDLDDVLNGTFDASRNEVYLGETSNFMTDVIGASAFSLYMPASKAYSAIVTEAEYNEKPYYSKQDHYHGIGKEDFLDILEKSETPIVAFADAHDQKGNPRDNRIVLVTDKRIKDLSTGTQEYAVVIEEVDSNALNRGKRIKANKTITVYPRAKLYEDIQGAIVDGRLLDITKKGEHLFAGVRGANSQAAIQKDALKRNIANFWANVKWKGEKTSSSSQKSTLTPVQMAFQKAGLLDQDGQLQYMQKDEKNSTDKLDALKKARNKMLFARGKASLTSRDEDAVTALLNGEMTLDELDDSYNKKDIEAVYEASLDYEMEKAEAEEMGIDVSSFTKKGGGDSFSISGNYAKEIDSWVKEGKPDGESFVLGSTGDVLQGLGAIESDIYMLSEKINEVLSEHPEMTVDEIKKIPQILDNPVLILKSKNVGRNAKANTRLVIFGTVKAKDGKPILSVLDLRPVENNLVIDDMQKVTSAYTKDVNPTEFIRSSEVLYAEKNITTYLLSAIGFKMPITCNQSGYIGSISYRSNSVNIKGEEFSKVFKEIYDNNTNSYSISTPVFTPEKAADEVVKRAENSADVTERLPIKAHNKLREVEKKLCRDIANHYGVYGYRVNELQEGVRRLTSEYLESGSVSLETIKEFADFMKERFGKEDSFTGEDGITYPLSNGVKFAIREAINSDLQFIKAEYKRISDEVNGKREESASEDMATARNERTRRFVSKKVRELRNTLTEDFGVAEKDKKGLEERIYALVAKISLGTFTEADVSSFYGDVFDSVSILDDTMKQNYPLVYSYLKTTKLTLSGSNKKDLAGYGSYKEFREDAPSFLKIGKEGTSVADMYSELNDLAPDLFPKDVINENDEAVKILEVAKRFVSSRVGLRETTSPEERKSLYDRTERAVKGLERDVRTAIRYSQGTATVTEQAYVEDNDVDVAEVTDKLEALKRERSKMLLARGKTILSDKDERALRAIIDGTQTIEGLDDSYNKKDIEMVYEASREYEKLKAEAEEYKRALRQRRYDRAKKYLEDGDVLTGFRDHSSAFLYMINPLERNLEYIGKRGEISQRLIDAYVKPIKRANRDGILYKNSIIAKIKALNLSRKAEGGNTHSESFAVQFVGEAESCIETLKRMNNPRATESGKSLAEWQAELEEFWKVNADMDKGKIYGAVEVFRGIYDELFRRMNEARVKSGYEPVSYRKGYFPHFNPRENNDFIALFGKSLGFNMEFDGLPTTINGLTHTFKPGIKYFGAAEARQGYETVFDAVEGMQRYLDGVIDVIFQTDNIQNLRALAHEIRYQASDEGLQSQENSLRARNDVTERQRAALIDELHEKGRYKLSNFVTDLEEYTNLLAGKKSKFDRGMESFFGRNMYSLVKSFNGKIAANMISWNVGSWLTNFIPLVQGTTGLKTKYMLQGMTEALVSVAHNDGFEAQSTFLATRRGSDELLHSWQMNSYKTKAGKAVGSALDASSEAGMKAMEWIDMYVANSLVRGRYKQNVAKGLDSEAALEEADSWAGGLMADRSKGGLPTVFGATNPVFKAFTQFQVEVMNQVGFFYRDVPKDLRDKNILQWCLAIFKYLLAAYLFDELYEKLTGRRPALDPLGIINDTVGNASGVQLNNAVDVVFTLAKGEGFDLTKEVHKMSAWNVVTDFTGEIVEEVPFVGGLFGGGRIPMSSALPDIEAIGQTLFSDANATKKWTTLSEEIAKPLAYAVLPGGGGQITKGIKGIKAVKEGGKYTVDSKGREKLQYPVTPNFATYLQAGLFGATATSGGQDWVKSGFSTGLSWKETSAYKAMVEEGATQDEAFDILDALGEIKEKDGDLSLTATKARALADSDLSDDVKRTAYEYLYMKDSHKEYTYLADEFGIGKEVFVDFLIENHDAKSKEELVEAFGDRLLKNGKVSRRGKELDNKTKAVLYQIITNNKTNPYNSSLGKRIWKLMNPDEKY